MNETSIKQGLLRAVLVVALSLTMPLVAAAADARTFSTPEAAVEALTSALRSGTDSELVALVGDKYRSLVVTGDSAHDAQVRSKLTAAIASYLVVEERGADRRVLLVGIEAWPFPIPVVRTGGAWRFAGEQGAEEVINRRIGGNERFAIHVMRSYVDAQRQYAARDRNADGVRQYAARLSSSQGKQDGLYWPADEAKGEEASPFGPLVAESAPGHKAGEPYRGYHYRILTAQGKSAAGGAYNYMINGRLIAGFGLVAYPAEPGTSGVMSFIVNHNGKVFQKSLGPATVATASKMTTFDPGPGWTEVQD